MDRHELLMAVYKLIPWDRLVELYPELTREKADELFRDIREALDRQVPLDEPGEADLEPARPPGVAPAVPADCSLVELYTDGASRGNPGPSGIGMAILLPDGTELTAWGESIGEATNNVAEYRAVIAGLEKALELGAQQVRLFCDSELLVRQVLGVYRVKSPDLKPLHGRVIELLERFKGWHARHIPRGMNARTDALASECARADSPPAA